MPTYDMHCETCGDDFSITQSIHDDLPTEHLGDCGPLVQVISPPVIHGIGGAAGRRQWQSQREKDIEAYRRLRKDGVQPKGVNGCAEIETRAGEQHEVERDVVFEDRKMAKKMTSATAEAEAIQNA